MRERAGREQGENLSIETGYLLQTYAEFMEVFQSGNSVTIPKDDQLLSPGSLLSQATNYVIVDAHSVQPELLDEKSQIALQASIRFHLLESLAIGSTPESYEFYDAVDNMQGFISDIEEILAEKSVAVGGSFDKVSEYARFIAYDKEYNDSMFSKIKFSERRKLFQEAAISLSQPYFDKLQTLTGGVN